MGNGFKRIVLLWLVLGVGVGASFSQTNVSLKFLGLTIHPNGDPTADLQPYKLDKRARFVMNFGGALGLEHYIFQDIISIKGMQALFSDCSAGLASATHVAVRGTFLNRGGHRLSVGFGPALIVRQPWQRLEGYQPSGYFEVGTLPLVGPVQWKFFWYGVELEYDYRLSDRLDLSVSFIPGLPFVMNLGAGVKYWFSRTYKEKLYLPKYKGD